MPLPGSSKRWTWPILDSSWNGFPRKCMSAVTTRLTSGLVIFANCLLNSFY